MINTKERIVFATRQVENNKYYKLSIYHNQGIWFVSWYEYTKKGIFECVDDICCAKNRTMRTYAKRFSKNDLLKLNSLVEMKIETYYGHWLRQDYGKLTNEILQDISQEIGV